jgi:dipeptidyl aminopeptidase/acylaminoacyl peptidase
MGPQPAARLGLEVGFSIAVEKMKVANHFGRDRRVRSCDRRMLLWAMRLAVLVCAGVWGEGRAAEPDTTADIIEPSANLLADGIPPIPAELAERVQSYTESRAASVLDWHPLRREILIATRFGNTNQLHWVKQPGGARKQLTFFAEPVGDATFEPTAGSYVVLGRDVGGNEFAQLYRLDFDDGRVTRISDGGRSQNGGEQWDRGGRRMAYMSTRRNGSDRDLWVIDPREPETDRLLQELSGGGWGIADWSPDDNQLVLVESLSINKSNLWLVDLTTGERRQLTKHEGDVSYGAAQFSPDGAGLFVTTDLDREYQTLCYLDFKSGKLSVLAGDLGGDVEDLHLSPDGRWLMLNVNELGASKIYAYDVEQRSLKAIEGVPVGVVTGGVWHKNSDDFAFNVAAARSTADVYSWNVASGEIERWTESELGGLIAEQLSEPTLIRWPSFDQQEITGFYYQPPKRFAGPRPVIINIHGGPEGQARPTFLARSNYLLNELGCAIIFPNVRGSSGFGKSYLLMDNGVKREDSVRDIGALLDWIAQQPELDRNRVMVTGGSYGGYMTLACATHYSDRLRCALDVVGISDFRTFLQNTESYRRDLRRVEYGDERDPEIAAFFQRIAPLNNADKIKIPLFVVQGGNDPRVPLSEAEQIVARVKDNGTPVWYLMANDEGHGFRKKSNADYQFYATVMFIQQHLLGGD